MEGVSVAGANTHFGLWMQRVWRLAVENENMTLGNLEADFM